MKVSTKEILVLDGRPLASVKSFAVITHKYISTNAYADAMNRTSANELHRLLNSWKLNSARQTSIEKYDEISLIIFNVNFTVMKNLAKENKINSFFYCYLTDNGIEYEYYEKDYRQDEFVMLDDTQSITFRTEGNIFTFSGKNFEQTVDFYPIEEFDCRLTKMFDVGEHEDSILDVIINKSGLIAFRYRSRYFITENKIEEDEISVIKSDDIEKDIKNFIKWYHEVYSVKLESRYFKNHYAYAMCDDDKILFYIDRQGRLFQKINITKPFGTIYRAYKSFYHLREKDNG